MILRFLKPFWFVAIIPIIKGVIQYILYRDVSGVLTLEAIAFGIIMLIAILRWRSISVGIECGGIRVSQGFILRQSAFICADKISCITVRRDILDMLLGSATCRINTEAGRASAQDFDIKLYARHAESVSRYIYGDECHTAICTSHVKIAIMALTASSAFSGLIVGVPVINQAAKLLGIALEDMIFDEITAAARRFGEYFPRAVRIVTAVLIVSYILSALVSFFRNMFFKIRVGSDKLDIESGLFVKRRTVFKNRDVNAAIIEQTPFMRLCRMFSMSVSIGGYGSLRGDRATVVPCGRHGRMHNRLMLYFPFLSCDGKPISAARHKGALQRFFFAPSLTFFLLIGISAASIYLFPYFDRLIFFLSVVFALIICYWSNLCLYNYRFGRIRFGDNISARGSKGFNSRELYCERKRVGEIRLIRYPTDIRFGTCKVKLTVASEAAESIRVRNVDFSAVKDEIYRCFKE